MIVIGVDTHKRTHALAAVDADTGQMLGEREIPATEQGQIGGLRWARELGQDIVWAVEDCRHVSQRFERSLVSAGERVLRVAPKLMGASRRGEREPGKSDQIDARAIARAVLREGIDVSLPPFSTSKPLRFDCCAITARFWSPSARD